MGYAQALRDHVMPDLGGMKLADLQRNDVQDLVDRIVATGAKASTVRNVLLPLRVICRRAKARGEIPTNPTQGLELPAVRGRRDRVATPSEAAALLAALPVRDRSVWATALYGGLRVGELQALHVEDVDLAAGLIHVQRGWDQYEGEQRPKSRAGERRVPIAAVLRPQSRARLRIAARASSSGAPQSFRSRRARSRSALIVTGSRSSSSASHSTSAATPSPAS